MTQHPRSRLAVTLTPVLLIGAVACGGDGIPTTPDLSPSLDAAPSAPVVFRQISAGLHHTCGVDTGDLAWCWGSNSFGELGTGALFDRSQPVRVRGGLRFREVSATEFHTCGLTHDGAAWCWGANGDGQLGDGTRTSRLVPVRVAGGHSFLDISAGVFFTCAIAADGAAWCWGNNQWGQLGNGGFEARTKPGRVRGGHTFTQLSAGGDHACAVRVDGVAYCWGLNQSGELGHGTHAGPEACLGESCSSRPLRVLGGHRFRQVVASVGHSCGVETDGKAWCWGLNHLGQLGTGSPGAPDLCGVGPCSDLALAVGGDLAFAELGSFGFHTCGVTAGGAAWCWGNNRTGQLGTGTLTGPELCGFGTPCATGPVRVAGDRLWRQVSGGGEFTCGITRSGRGFCWGSNRNGELGVGTEDGPEDCGGFGACSATPRAIAAPRR